MPHAWERQQVVQIARDRTSESLLNRRRHRVQEVHTPTQACGVKNRMERVQGGRGKRRYVRVSLENAEIQGNDLAGTGSMEQHFR
ncbi:MAG: hypothetical protein AVDCRST_MAG68-2220 [uncultured Gemmatimonadetes bacterium]|uniref:Uncharacterized protein n=1 Tax=uncultured Gemmatimonadota bacterium TaxID=203437 RepID=A0A6J4L967_9BACT|nr:MAG: hypothetical protein AVDCRST_MAG68-2220 [uncultured Gemmatimonadota bacterium]